MRRVLIAASVSMMLAWAAPAMAQETPTAAVFAQKMQDFVGQSFEGGVTVKAIASEAPNTLVMTVDGPAGWRGIMTPTDISNALIEGFCSAAPQFFTTGVTIRVDSIDGGKLVRGPMVTACPETKPAQ